jgi:hypothetical protein
MARKTKTTEVTAEAAREGDQGEAAAQWETVTRLFAQGLDRPAISKQTGIPYGRLTYILWHQKWGVGAIPGMPECGRQSACR